MGWTEASRELAKSSFLMLVLQAAKSRSVRSGIIWTIKKYF